MNPFNVLFFQYYIVILAKLEIGTSDRESVAMMNNRGPRMDP